MLSPLYTLSLYTLSLLFLALFLSLCFVGALQTKKRNGILERESFTCIHRNHDAELEILLLYTEIMKSPNDNTLDLSLLRERLSVTSLFTLQQLFVDNHNAQLKEIFEKKHFEKNANSYDWVFIRSVVQQFINASSSQFIDSDKMKDRIRSIMRSLKVCKPMKDEIKTPFFGATADYGYEKDDEYIQTFSVKNTNTVLLVSKYDKENALLNNETVLTNSYDADSVLANAVVRVKENGKLDGKTQNAGLLVTDRQMDYNCQRFYMDCQDKLRWREW